jgi:hypothetical protein
MAMKNPYPTEPYSDNGQPLGTRWLRHPIAGYSTVTILSDRA